VGKTTASDALNGSVRVSRKTALRVQQAAIALNYTANPAARSLRKGRVGLIGLHAGWSSRTPSNSEYYMSALQSVLDRADADGLDVIVMSHSVSPQRVFPRCDGVIVLDPVVGSSATDILLNGPAPVVTGERAVSGSSVVASVSSDHEVTFGALLEHLLERGARRIGFLYCPELSDWAMRLKACFDDWAAVAPGYHSAVPVPFLWSAPQVEDALDELMAREVPPDAIVCGPLGSAAYVADSLRRRGLEPRRDVLLAACGDGPELRSASPAITAIHNDPSQLGEACVNLLQEYLTSGKVHDKEVNLPGRLIVRESTVYDLGQMPARTKSAAGKRSAPKSAETGLP
jgi:DNA-binding LacI/PurR family transcriptional regulator